MRDDTWELYDTRTDFSLVNDLAVTQPAKLAEMQALFMKEAQVNHALPLDDRSTERFNAALAGRPDLMAGRKSLTLYAGMKGLSENAFINVKGQSHSITADVTVPKGVAQGVMLAQSGRFGGWSLYVKNGRPVYHYNWLGLERFSVSSSEALAPGTSTVRLSFSADSSEPGGGGIATLFINDRKVGEGRIAKTQCCVFSIDEGADVGLDEGTPVTEAYASPFAFTGTIKSVTVTLSPTGTHTTAAP